MKKFLKDNTLENQVIPIDKLKDVFGDDLNPEMLKPENQEKSNKYIVVKTVFSNKYNYQIIIQNLAIQGNNSYMIFLFDKEDNYLGNLIISAASVFPPVYEKCMGLDYFDFQKIQQTVNDTCQKQFGFAFEVDNSYKDKCVYCTIDKDGYEKYLRGEQFQIVAIFAEKYFEQNKVN